MRLLFATFITLLLFSFSLQAEVDFPAESIHESETLVYSGVAQGRHSSSISSVYCLYNGGSSRALITNGSELKIYQQRVLVGDRLSTTYKIIVNNNLIAMGCMGFDLEVQGFVATPKQADQ